MLETRVKQATLPVIAELRKRILRLKISYLAIGDVIELDHKIEDPLIIKSWRIYRNSLSAREIK